MRLDPRAFGVRFLWAYTRSKPLATSLMVVRTTETSGVAEKIRGPSSIYVHHVQKF